MERWSDKRREKNRQRDEKREIGRTTTGREWKKKWGENRVEKERKMKREELEDKQLFFCTSELRATSLTSHVAPTEIKQVFQDSLYKTECTK